jgi:Tol biopolymer transport system component
MGSYQSSDLYLLRVRSDMQVFEEPKRITFDDRWTDQPAWTTDGRALVFGSNRGGTRALWRMPAQPEGSAELLPLGGDEPQNPTIALQGHRLVYVRSLQDTNIWQFNLPTGRQPAAAPSPLITSTLLDANAQFSPDGRKIAFESSRSGSHEIWVALSDGSHPVQVTNSSRGYVGTPRWSPDGTQLVFDSNVAGNFDVYVINAEGGGARRLTTGPGDNDIPSWSRDGKSIYFTSFRTGMEQICKINAVGGEAQQITTAGGAIPFESPDGKWLYYKKHSNDAGALWRMSVNGGAETMVIPHVFWRNFAVMPGGVYFMGQDGAKTWIGVHRFGTGKTEPLITIPKPPYVGLAVTPDESRIVYSQIDSAGRNIVVVDHFR